MGLLFNSCWNEQNLPVAPPAHPVYSLYGTITKADSGFPLRDAMVRVTMVELYQGEYLDPVETFTDSLGFYRFTGLYRAQYDLRITHRHDWLYDGSVGLIEYSDKEFNIRIPDVAE